MKKQKFAFLLLIIFCSCKYSPSDIPETYIEKPSESDAAILFELQPDVDTIKLFEPTTLLYNIDTLNKKLYKVEFYLDDVLLETQSYFNTEPFELQFNTNNYNEGFYKFSAKVYTSSNSGSLANILGAEGFIFQHDWTMIIDKTEPRELNFISIDSVENGVKLTWETFDHASFEFYRVTKTSSASYETSFVFETVDPKRNWFIDTNYVEGDVVNYEIKLNGGWGERREYYQRPLAPDISYAGGFDVDVSWRKVRNPLFLDFYYIYTSPNSSSVEDDQKINDANITSKRFTVPFGKTQYFGIMYAPYYAIYYSQLLKGETNYEMGEEMPPHDYMQRITSTPYILLNKGNKVYKYNMETDEFIDSIDIALDISWNFSLSWDCNYFGYSENSEFYLRSTNDLYLISKLSSPVYDGNSANLLTYQISDNKKLLTVYRDKSMKLFDLEQGTKITEFQTNATSSIFATLSSDGRYIIAKEYSNPVILMYYEVINDEIVEIKKDTVQNYDYADLRYAFGKNDEVYILYQRKLEIRNKIDFSVNRIVTLPDGYLLRTSHEHMITIITDKSNTQKAYLVDMQNGQILHEVLLDGSSYISLQGNYLTSSIGRKLNLDNLK